MSKWRTFTCILCGATVQVLGSLWDKEALNDELEAWCNGGVKPHRKSRMVEVEE